jgi:hypothetical protein
MRIELIVHHKSQGIRYERYGSVLKFLCLLAVCFKSFTMRLFEFIVFLASLAASHPTLP